MKDTRQTLEKHTTPLIPVATEVALRLTVKDGLEVPLSYWDVWYALLAKNQFDGDLNRLACELRKERGGSLDAAKLSHLRDFQQRLTQASLGLSEVLSFLPPELVKTEGRRAQGRILKHNQRSYELSEPMRVLPRDRFCEVALHGLWGRFPVSPEPAYQHLRAEFNWSRCYGENASWGLARKLDKATEDARQREAKGKFAEALAALRAILTVAIELVEIADDSFGSIGQSFQEAFNNYLAFPRHKTGLAYEDYLADLLELLVFEGYGLTYDQTDGFFASLSLEEGDFCLTYLRGRIPALLAWDLDYQAEKALTLIGAIAAEQKRFDSFVALAGELGSRHWKRIILLADAAVRSRKRDLADSVFEATLSVADGGHRDFLKTKHSQLLSGKWNPDPRK